MNADLLEAVSAAVHAAWMEAKAAAGVTTRRLETGEELLVPYEELSERAKDLDRGSVRAVLDGLERAGYAVVKRA